MFANPFFKADFVTLSDGIFSAADLRLMELELLCTLKWHLNPPTFHTFINLLTVLFDEGDIDLELLASRSLRFAESTRLHVDFIKYPPSMIAVASIICALKQLDVRADVVTKWMHLVNQCHLTYAQRPDATKQVTECGRKLIDLVALSGGGLDSSMSCDAEVESANDGSKNSNQKGLDPDRRKQAGTPTDVMDIEQIEKYNQQYGMVYNDQKLQR